MKKFLNNRIIRFLKNKLRWADSADLNFKLISLSIAVILHLLLILYLRQAKVYVKILPFKTETEVAVKKYPPVNFPSNLPEVINQPPQPKEAPTGGQAGEKTPGGSGIGAGVPSSGPAARAKSQTEKPTGQETPSVPFDLESFLAYRPGEEIPQPPLRLNLSTHFQSSSKYHFSLKLPVRPETPEAGGEKNIGNIGPGNLKSNVYQYLSPEAYRAARQSLRFSPAGKIIVPGTGLTGVGPQGQAGYHYDIKPWAEKVVNLIQAKWILPEMALMPENKNVGLIIRVDRDGQLLSLEINSSTSSDLLDEAAVAAVKLSAPFPPLPADFPGKSLEFYLVFTYHE
ncbi:MAG: TonB family protein [Candidatus Saccharicenans sp.]|nr:TonB C-terminal domain-containing protein [Candidatus Aminicenantes bacterium]